MSKVEEGNCIYPIRRFGAGFRSQRNGIIYNDEMNDFAIPGGNLDGFPAAPSNFVKPGKIPLSSSAPLIITDENGDVKMVIGASGGTRIITAIVFVSHYIFV